jgi:hypothetical protein
MMTMPFSVPIGALQPLKAKNESEDKLETSVVMLLK